jgi:hypothetical protein
MDYLGQGTLTQAMTKSSFVIKVFFFLTSDKAKLKTIGHFDINTSSKRASFEQSATPPPLVAKTGKFTTPCLSLLCISEPSWRRKKYANASLMTSQARHFCQATCISIK